MKRAAAIPLVLALLAACGGGKNRTSAPAPAPSRPEAAAPEQSGAAPMAKASVTLYFPSAADDRLEAETREIVDTKRPADRGAQILTALLEGPQSNAALPAVPPGTTLRRLWVREDGNAYADFSEELASGLTGGSADELLTVYAIVDSLTSNVPSIRRVGILVAGRERETLGGHVDVRRPLLPNSSLAPQAKAAP